MSRRSIGQNEHIHVHRQAGAKLRDTSSARGPAAGQTPGRIDHFAVTVYRPFRAQT